MCHSILICCLKMIGMIEKKYLSIAARLVAQNDRKDFDRSIAASLMPEGVGNDGDELTLVWWLRMTVMIARSVN